MKNIYPTTGRQATLGLLPQKGHLKSAVALLGQPLWLFRILSLCLVITSTNQLKAQDVTVDNPISADTTINAKNTITANKVVQPPAQAIFRAGQSIFLQEGFRAGDVQATIGSALLAQSGLYFIASQAVSDAYIDLEWEIPVRYTDLPENGILYLQILNKDTREQVHYRESYVHYAQEKGKLEGTYRHFIGDELQVNYELQVFLEGPGHPMIATMHSSGTTGPYQAPTVTVSQGTFPDRVEITLQNHSDLVGEYRILRDDGLIANLNTTATAYQDQYSFTSANSLVNGEAYTYRIQPYSNLFEKLYAETEHPGSTGAINVQATDNAYADNVEITWNNITGFADAIEITRDGEILATLPGTSVTFIDIRPINGQTHQYGVVLVQNGQRTVAAYDQGGIAPNGGISGRAASLEGNIATANARVVATTELDGIAISDTVYTDITGHYAFNDLRYGESAEYTLTVSLEGHTFQDNPRALILNRQAPTLSGVNFSDEYSYLEGNTVFGFSNLTVAANGTADNIQLDWDYERPASGEPVYFKISRKTTNETNTTLVALVTDDGVSPDQYRDLSGIPGTDYTYTVEAYIQQSDTVSQISLNGNAIYPQAAVASITATANGTLGTINLDWAHTSENFTGFNLYRDSLLVTTLSSNTTAYTDLQGVPGTTYTYKIAAYVEKEGQAFESALTATNPVTYPALPPVTNLTVVAQPDQDKVLLDWANPAVDAGYNYDGVNIYRGEEKIGTVLKTLETTFTDRTGIPGTAYTYTVKTFKQNGTTDDESPAASIQGTYPAIKAPHGLMASQGTHPGYINLQWQHTSENYDGFTVYRGNDEVATVPTGTLVYSDPVPGQTGSIPYTVKAYRDINDARYESEGALANGSAQTDGGGTFPQTPDSFMASTGLAGHVLLQWGYPEYIHSKFNIYRDNELLATLPTDHRVYYDYEALPGQTYLYQIQAEYEGDRSYRAGAQGRLTSINSLSGTVVSSVTGQGVEGAAIKVTVNLQNGIQYVKEVTTGPAGHYHINGVPNREGGQLVVTAGFQNHAFEQSQQNIPITESTTAYTANFTDITGVASPDYQPGAAIASPVGLSATPDPVGQSVRIGWNTSSNNFSGFKVYRGLTEIADLSSQHERVVIDSTGFPGYDYPYRVKAYWDTPYGKKESDYVSAIATYPIIPPVSQLQAIQLEEEDQVKITWSHPADKHGYYRIVRNGEPLDSLPTGQAMEYIDLNGTPGQLYKYTVFAVKNTPQGLFESVPAQSEAIYPLLSQVFQLESTVPANQHHLQLDWQHTSGNIEGYFLYRDSTLIDTLYRQDTTAYRTIDREARPGPHRYQVTTFTTRGDLAYESVPVNLEVSYPDLLLPTNLTAQPDNLRGTVKLDWGYTADDIEGYEIYRNGTLIATLLKGATSLVDATGTPGVHYTYGVEAFDLRRDTVSSSPATIDAQYPNVPAPTSITASDTAFFNHITIGWGYEALNNEGFYIYRDGTNVGTVAGGQRNFREVFQETTSGSYQVSAFRKIAGIIYESDRSSPDPGSTKDIQPSPYLTNMAASDGAYINKTKLTWKYTGPGGNVKIYREEEHIKTVPATDEVYSDTEGQAGKKYIYRALLADGRGSADLGHRKADGVIDGLVIARQSGMGVPGVAIKATTTIDGQHYTYSDTTDAAGEYEIREVYYGSGATYNVSPSYPGHIFQEDTLAVGLDTFIKQTTVDPFIDLIAYKISGLVTKGSSNCAIDSVKVTLTTTRDGMEIQETDTTDATGSYSFDINPQDPEVTRYQLTIDTIKVANNSGQQDTTHFQFAQPQRTFSKGDIEDFLLNEKVDFEETTTHQVTLVVQNTCGAIGTDRFDIRVRSKGGCFNQVYQTGTAGSVTITLPPMEYTMAVTGVDDPSPGNQAMVDYLRVRPAALALTADATIAFTYHKAPEINITGLNRFLCNDPERPAIIRQDSSYTLNVSAFEDHSTRCPVNEGFLVVKNAAATITTDTLWYGAMANNGQGGFPAYTFTAGEPITIAPYTLGMVVEYHTENGGYQGEKVQQLIVEGEKTPPGNDIIVSVDDDENGQVKLPLFILRDPPGDQSYSYVEKGKTFSKSLTVSDMNSGSAGIETDMQFAVLGLGIYAKASISAGGGEGESAAFNVSVTTKQQISTAEGIQLDEDSGQYLKGDQADVIVGTGLSTAYGIVERIAIDSDGCTITKSSDIRLVADGLTTEWHYSVFQIEKLIKEYDRQLNALTLRDGTLNMIGSDSTAMTADEAYTYISTLKDNWQEILRYHRTETVPICQVCDLDNLPQPFKAAVEGMEEYQSFCNQVRSNGVCNLESFTWTNELMTQYNRLNQFREDLEDYIDYRYNDGVAIKNGAEAVIITDNILNNLDLDGEYQNLYGPEVENITFDGASGAITNEVTVAKSQSRGYSQKTFFNLDIAVGALIFMKFEVTKGLAVSVTTQEELKNFNKIGITGNYHFDFNKTKENTSEESATVGYVLSDDDVGDQFSVTVVKGIDPAHTPYFSLLGGRSSCPPEAGTILRDVPQLTLEYPDNTLANNVQYDVDPNGKAVFPLKLSNGNPFGENRLYELALSGSSNPGNASVTVQGNPLLVSRPFYIEAGESVYTTVSIERGAVLYDYENITLSLRPVCDAWSDQSVNLSVHFRRPCSPVSLISDGNRTVDRGGTADGNRWVISKAPEGEREQLFLKLVDYDPESTVLEDIVMEYRQANTNHWNPIDTLSVDTLKVYYEDNIGTYPQPTYPYVWDITDMDLADGEYEIRSRTNCGSSGENFSNLLTGIIDRTSIQLFGTPQPSDGLLSLGDEISVNFNEAISCTGFDRSMLTLVKVADGSGVAFTTTCRDNQVVVVIPGAMLNILEGETLRATISGVSDPYGNVLAEPVEWDFTVHRNPVYWYPDSLEVVVFRGGQTQAIARLFNTSGGPQPFSLSGQETAWLQAGPTNGQVPPSGLEVALEIDASTLPVGMHEATLTASTAGFGTEALKLKVQVLPQLPEWEVPEELYQNNMGITANFNLDNMGLSTDALDMISVWIGNSLRGVANISEVTDAHHVAYLTVAGHPEDEGDTLSFRVWDASAGIEYDGYPGQVYTYGKDTHYGTTVAPVTLTVNSASDKARYVPLKAGWNWISFNTVQADMSVGNLLKSLSPTEGDQVKTMTATSHYSQANGWTSIDGLDALDTKSGYQLYLAKADTLRLTGADATMNNITLQSGWNLLGYQPQEALPLNKALQNFGAEDGNILKTQHGFAEYQLSLGGWNGIDMLRPNEGYKIKLANGALFQYHNSVKNPGGNAGQITGAASSPTGHRDSNGTRESRDMAKYAHLWSVNPARYEYNMTFTGAIAPEEGQEVHPGSKVVVFVDGECRGIGELVYLEALGRYVTSLFVYANTEGEEVTFKIVDEEIEKVYGTVNKEVFAANTHHGSFTEPYLFQGREVLSASSMLMAYPNPFERAVTVKFNTEQGGNHRWVLRDEVGALILSGEVGAVRGMNTLTLDLGRELPAGMYLLSLTGNTTHKTIKLMKHD